MMVGRLIRPARAMVSSIVSAQRLSIHGTLQLSQRCKTTDTQSDELADRSTWVTVTDDGNTIVCWHPEVKHQYKYTRPLPENWDRLEPQLEETPLKIQYIRSAENMLNEKGPNLEELQCLTHQPRHVFKFQPGRIKKMQHNLPIVNKDRDGV